MHYSPHTNSRAFLFEIFKDLRKKHGGEAQSDEGKNWDRGIIYSGNGENQSNLDKMKLPGRTKRKDEASRGLSCVHMAP